MLFIAVGGARAQRLDHFAQFYRVQSHQLSSIFIDLIDSLVALKEALEEYVDHGCLDPLIDCLLALQFPKCQNLSLDNLEKPCFVFPIEVSIIAVVFFDVPFQLRHEEQYGCVLALHLLNINVVCELH